LLVLSAADIDDSLVLMIRRNINTALVFVQKKITGSHFLRFYLAAISDIP
jgi:hypothetical protein